MLRGPRSLAVPHPAFFFTTGSSGGGGRESEGGGGGRSLGGGGAAELGGGGGARESGGGGGARESGGGGGRGDDLPFTASPFATCAIAHGSTKRPCISLLSRPRRKDPYSLLSKLKQSRVELAPRFIDILVDIREAAALEEAASKT
jgi:hypothetical protein